MKRSLATILVGAGLALPNVALAQFTYMPAGELVAGSGTGRMDTTVYVPGMRFPIENAPAYANSQVWGHGGSQGPGGGQCDSNNYSYPWWDNYCESRTHNMPLCPSGTGHQGQDIRPATCDDSTHWAVAVDDGTITNVGSFSVSLTRGDGTRFRYLHLDMSQLAVSNGQSVRRGDRIGLVSNDFGGTPTTIHLHFDIFQNVVGTGNVYVPTYLSLVEAYQDLIGPTTPPLDARFVGASSNAPAGAVTDYVVCAGATFTFSLELENTGTARWADLPGGSSNGDNVRLGVPGDTLDPFTGTSRISIQENANSDVDPSGGDCSDAPGCRRTVFTAGGIAATAPSVPGVVTTRWQLVDEGRVWFGPEMSLDFDVVDCSSGVGGATGTGGSLGTGGLGTGGSVATGGSPATGGAVGFGGSAGTDAPFAVEQTSRVISESSGCGCRTAGSRGDSWGWLVAFAWLWMRRRRR